MSTPGFTPVDASSAAGFTPVDEPVKQVLKQPANPNLPSVHSYDPGFMDRMRSALPIIDRIQTGLSRLTTPSSNQAVLAKPLEGMSDERAVAPEKLMTPSEQQKHPIVTGAGEFAGGLTTPDNMLLSAGMMGPLPSAITRTASGMFAVQMLRGAAQGWQPFKDAIQKGEQTGDYSEAQRLGTHLTLGATFGMMSGKQALSGRMGIPGFEQMTKDGRDIAQMEAQVKSKGGIQTSGLGLYNSIANTINTHIEGLKAKAVSYMEPVIAADKAKGGTPIDTAGIKAQIDAVKAANGYHTSPAEDNLLSQIGGQQVHPAVDQTAKTYYQKSYNQLAPDQQQGLNRLLPPDLIPQQGQSMTIDKLLQLRTDIGNAAVRNKDVSGKATMWAAYDAVGDTIRDSTSQIHGDTSPFEKYNNRFQMAFDLQKKGMSADMLQNVRNPFTVKADKGAIDLLRQFTDAEGDRNEIKDQMLDMGTKGLMDKMDRHVKDAKAISSAYDSVEGRNLKSITRQFMQNPKQAWPGVAFALATHGLLPFPFSFLMPAAISAAALDAGSRTKAGKLGLRLRSELPPEYFQGRPTLMQDEPEQ